VRVVFIAPNHGTGIEPTEGDVREARYSGRKVSVSGQSREN
jgi:hypothetical protein